jgi:hypothetical protein
MDSSVSELEFSTLRSLQAPPDFRGLEDDQPARQGTIATVAAAAAARSRQASIIDGKEETDVQDTISAPSPREVLVAPPQPPSDLELDATSIAHILGLIHQSVENVGLQDRNWEVCPRKVPVRPRTSF